MADVGSRGGDFVTELVFTNQSSLIGGALGSGVSGVGTTVATALTCPPCGAQLPFGACARFRRERALASARRRIDSPAADAGTDAGYGGVRGSAASALPEVLAAADSSLARAHQYAIRGGSPKDGVLEPNGVEEPTHAPSDCQIGSYPRRHGSTWVELSLSTEHESTLPGAGNGGATTAAARACALPPPAGLLPLKEVAGIELKLSEPTRTRCVSRISVFVLAPTSASSDAQTWQHVRSVDVAPMASRIPVHFDPPLIAARLRITLDSFHADINLRESEELACPRCARVVGGASNAAAQMDADGGAALSRASLSALFPGMFSTDEQSVAETIGLDGLLDEIFARQGTEGTADDAATAAREIIAEATTGGVETGEAYLPLGVTAAGNPELCTRCREPVLQCRRCRSISYDEPNGFMCSECGYSRHMRGLDVHVTMRSYHRDAGMTGGRLAYTLALGTSRERGNRGGSGRSKPNGSGVVAANATRAWYGGCSNAGRWPRTARCEQLAWRRRDRGSHAACK